GRDWVGCRGRVRFGGRPLVGLVAGLASASGLDASRLRAVEQRLDARPLLAGELWQSLAWCARYYQHPLGEVLWTALPGPLREGRPLPQASACAWRLTAAGRAGLASLRAGSRPRTLAEQLAAAGDAVPEAVLAVRLPGWRDAAKRLAARGFAERVPAVATAVAAAIPAPPPTPAQAAAVAALAEARGFLPVLLEGVTGSGKTEVY